ncbi:MAG: HesA/MoeB/ThiF family protein [Candidatus Caldarchaeum sp.]|nr:HesA/MoeB/ThiF family protein [Candidatus Caldarchaeum sp.]MDW8435601.1 HesA/MoeB/ThiF family protein [Candidatus Caldarchaeum sp.]
MSGAVLSGRELERYDRQLRVPEIGLDGQGRLKRSKVLVAGVGGLGGVASMYLAAAGVGFVRLVEDGVLELSNLNRQLPYSEQDLGSLKVQAAAKRLRSLNSDIVVEPVPERITSGNVVELVRGVDVVVDGMDNFETRFLLNDACVELGVPFIHGAVHGFEGRLMTVIPGVGPCLRCLMPELPKVVETIPVVGPVPGVIGSLQALETLKILTGAGKTSAGRLLVFNGLDMDFVAIPVNRSPKCPACGKKM